MTNQKIEQVAKAAFTKFKELYLRQACDWIADEDNPGDNQPIDELTSTLTVALVADLFETTTTDVATRVWNTRNRVK